MLNAQLSERETPQQQKQQQKPSQIEFVLIRNVFKSMTSKTNNLFCWLYFYIYLIVIRVKLCDVM